MGDLNSLYANIKKNKACYQIPRKPAIYFFNPMSSETLFFDISICRSVKKDIKLWELLEAVSKLHIGFKAKAGRSVQPQEYMEYFED